MTLSAPHRQEDWLSRLAQLLGPDFGVEPGKEPGERARVEQVLELLHHGMPLLASLQDEVEISDAVKYGYLSEHLKTVLSFDSFSLAEYIYHQPGGHTPGVRVWLYRQEFGLTLSVLLFPNVGQWQVDQVGNKINTELLRLDLTGAEPKVWTSILDGVDKDTPWQEALLRALVAPLG